MKDEKVYQEAYTDFRHSLSYGDYLSLETLLEAQKPLTEAHDEMLFIIIHHVQELWMKLLIHELKSAMKLLEQDIIDPALKMLTRVCRAQEQMAASWEVLKTMTPADYLEFRSSFGQASGFQSHQYRLIEFLLGNKNPFMMRPHQHHPQHYGLLEDALKAPSLYDLALQILAKRGLTVLREVLERDYAKPYEPHPAVLQAWLSVYRNTLEHWDLYYLAEKLIDVEDNFRRWRFNHLVTVERMIGHKRGSGGTAGVGYLKKVLEVVLFPELWQVRTEL